MGVGQKHEWKIRSSIRNNIKIYHPIVDVIENENNAQIQSELFSKLTTILKKVKIKMKLKLSHLSCLNRNRW